MKIKALFLKKIYNISSKVDDDIYIFQEKNKIVCQSIMEGKAVLLEIIHNIECEPLDKPIVFDLSKIRNVLSVLNDDEQAEKVSKKLKEIDEYATKGQTTK